MTVLVILTDIWSLVLLGKGQLNQTAKVFGYIWIGIEIGLKVVLIILMGMWRQHIFDNDDKN